MEKHTIEMIRQDLKAKRDALALAHEQLKKDNDDWNKLVITMSLFMGLFESIKMRLQWTDDLSSLVPIALSSIIASVSALIKFKKFPEQMEILLQAQSLLTHTLNNARIFTPTLGVSFSKYRITISSPYINKKQSFLIPYTRLTKMIVRV